MLYSAILLEGEDQSCPVADAREMAPEADRILGGVAACDSADFYAALRTVALKYSTLRDDPDLEGADRDGVVARAGFKLGVATAYRLMTAIGGAR
jgi:hypothetical protein